MNFGKGSIIGSKAPFLDSSINISFIQKERRTQCTYRLHIACLPKYSNLLFNLIFGSIFRVFFRSSKIHLHVSFPRHLLLGRKGSLFNLMRVELLRVESSAIRLHRKFLKICLDGKFDNSLTSNVPLMFVYIEYSLMFVYIENLIRLCFGPTIPT